MYQIGHLLKCIRAHRSQDAMNKKFGFSFNLISRWERQTSHIFWHDFVRFCSYCKVPLELILKNHLRYNGSLKNDVKFVKFLLENCDILRLERTAQISKQTILRYISGKKRIKVKDILLIIDSIMGASSDILADIYLHLQIDLPADLQLMLLRKDVMATYPESALIDGLFMREEYKSLATHKNGYIAKLLGITLEREQKILDAMIKCEMLRIEEGKYTYSFSSIRTRPLSFLDHANMLRYWLNYGQKILENQIPFGYNDKISMFGYRILAVDCESEELIRQKILNFNNEIRQIVLESKIDFENIRIFQMGIFDPVFLAKKL